MRYFLEVSYKGTSYSGFQVQENAPSIQFEVEKVLAVFFRKRIMLTGSSRTDAGVHALQNYFHFDFDDVIPPKAIYNFNAMLPSDIVVKGIYPVDEEKHARFHATARHYRYFLTAGKNPFLVDRAWFYPYKLDFDLLQMAAVSLFNHFDYTSFAKRNSQVHTHDCTIQKSNWFYENDCLVYEVKSNRFLRGMVRGLVSTMLLVGRNKITINDFENIIQAKDCTKANFTTPAHGLFLINVEFPFDLKPL